MVEMMLRLGLALVLSLGLAVLLAWGWDRSDTLGSAPALQAATPVSTAR